MVARGGWLCRAASMPSNPTTLTCPGTEIPFSLSAAIAPRDRLSFPPKTAVQGRLPLQPHHYSDGPAWITPTVVAYLKETGDSISGWITGTAGWMFRAVLEYFCGVRPGYHDLEIRPCLPSTWDHVKVRRTFRGKEFLIEITRSASGEIAVTVNGATKAG